MTAEQKEIRDHDLADAVREALRQLQNAINVAERCGIEVEIDQVDRDMPHITEDGKRAYPIKRLNIRMTKVF